MRAAHVSGLSSVAPTSYPAASSPSIASGVPKTLTVAVPLRLIRRYSSLKSTSYDSACCWNRSAAALFGSVISTLFAG
jgi:hypothetical protein